MRYNQVLNKHNEIIPELKDFIGKWQKMTGFNSGLVHFKSVEELKEHWNRLMKQVPTCY